jgi:hypothetical protein
MSDINIRFDGIVLLGTLALSAVLYLLIAMIALIVALTRTNRRASKVSLRAALLAVATFVISSAFFVSWDRHGTGYSGADSVDQLTSPWIAVFLAGCWWLKRVR